MGTEEVANPPLIVVRGGGDLGTAAAGRLHRVGLRVLVTEKEKPTAVRRTVAFSTALYSGCIQVEELRARRATDTRSVEDAWACGAIPVVPDPDLLLARSFDPMIVLDALVAKRNLGMSRALAPGTIALGPGFVAGIDVDAVVETNRGPNLGRVLWSGAAEPNTSSPAPVEGHTRDRVLRAPVSGMLTVVRDIPEVVSAGVLVALVGERPVHARFEGMIRGMLHDGLHVDANMKIGDIEPRLNRSLCFSMSDKALAVAGGTVEATIVLLRRNGLDFAFHEPDDRP